MKLTLIPLFALFSTILLAAEGDTLYVSDVLYVPVRATGCATCSILHRGLVSGSVVTDLGEEQDGWTKVRTANGIEGWMPNQFLVTQQISRVRVPQLETDLAALRAENGQLTSQINTLMAELQESGIQVETIFPEGEDGESGQFMYRISGDLSGLNAQNQELVRRNQLMQNDLDILRAENERLLDTRWRSWFIYGALAVIAGSILSSLATRLRKRRGFSEWA